MDDAELLRRFEDHSLPFEQWTHRAHVRVAYCYLHRLPFEKAVAKITSGIRAYNAAKNVPEGPNSGYNETTTVAFAKLVAATMAAYSEVMPTPDSEAFCDAHPQLLQKHILRIFYSPLRRTDPRAKYEFLEPDLTSLPVHRVD